MSQFKGTARSDEVGSSRRRRDTRRFGERFKAFFESGDGAAMGLFILPLMALALVKIPVSGELLLLIAWWYRRRFVEVAHRGFNFPMRVPLHAHVGDGSYPKVKDKKTGKMLWKRGNGISYLAQDLETKEPFYASDTDLRTHMLVLGTTGSGKTEFLLGLVANALVQNTGCIYVDGKGDPKLQNQIFRLARYFHREHDLLIVNFITSGRDFVEKQVDMVTNTMNLMANSSSGMLIELIVSLMDDSGGGGDMWKGRAISFVASLTRPLIYLRDKGYINLSPEKYLEYFEINVIEDMVWQHNGKYGATFDTIVAPLRSYLVTLPGYQPTKQKKQEQKTLEQHGFIVMQLTRVFNDLTFNYGHIFKCKVGDVDFYDVVINRRILVTLLPALERAPDSLKMLGKMIVGSIKQMMAGCLGNRVEGVVREIIDSRPTNSPVPFYTILDEYGFYAVVGFSVAPAQARSLGFAVIFAAQDFSSLKKSSAEEADSTWENTNVRVVGRLTSGQKSETWDRIQGAAGEADSALIGGFERKMGAVNESFRLQDNVGVERRSRIEYDDFAKQADGEFHLIVGKKEDGGKGGGVRVARGMGFFTGSKSPKEMRCNDFLPVESPEPNELPQARAALDAIKRSFASGDFPDAIRRCIKPNDTMVHMAKWFDLNYTLDRPKLSRPDAAYAVLGKFLQGASAPKAAGGVVPPRPSVAAAPTPAQPAGLSDSASGTAAGAADTQRGVPASIDLSNTGIASRLMSVASRVVSGEIAVSAYSSAVEAPDDSDAEIRADVVAVTDLYQVSNEEANNFRELALPILRQNQLTLDDVDAEPESDPYDDVAVADTDQMLDIEMAARNGPFTSLSEKHEVEDNVTRFQASLAATTRYPHLPTPETLPVSTLTSNMDAMTQLMRGKIKQAFDDGIGPAGGEARGDGSDQ